MSPLIDQQVNDDFQAIRRQREPGVGKRYRCDFRG